MISFGIGNANSERINYGFTYHNNSWQQLEYDPLEWRWNHEETEKGKIKNALKRKRKRSNLNSTIKSIQDIMRKSLNC